MELSRSTKTRFATLYLFHLKVYYLFYAILSSSALIVFALVQLYLHLYLGVHIQLKKGD